MNISCIAVGIDGSDGSLHALSWAAELAQSVGARILAVHVVPESWLLELSAFQLKTDGLVEERRTKLGGEWTEGLRSHRIDYSTAFAHGNPATELLRLAEQYHAELVVVGGSRHGGPRRGSMLGHTSHRVANYSTLPVVVVPAPDDGTKRTVPIPG